MDSAWARRPRWEPHDLPDTHLLDELGDPVGVAGITERGVAKEQLADASLDVVPVESRVGGQSLQPVSVLDGFGDDFADEGRQGVVRPLDPLVHQAAGQVLGSGALVGPGRGVGELVDPAVIRRIVGVE